MKKLMCVPLLWASVSVWGACESGFPEELPVVPAGDQATTEQMYEAQKATLDYVEAGKRYLNCARNLNQWAFDRKVDSLREVADAYNKELARFKEQNSLIAGS